MSPPETRAAAHSEGASVNINIADKPSSDTPPPSGPTTSPWSKVLPLVYVLSGLGGGTAAQAVLNVKLTPNASAVTVDNNTEIRDVKDTLHTFLKEEKLRRETERAEKAAVQTQLDAIKTGLDELLKLHPRRR